MLVKHGVAVAGAGGRVLKHRDSCHNLRLLLMKPVVSLLSALVAVHAVGKAVAQQRPNVVVIISDDAGFADFGFQSSVTGTPAGVPTPSLDALAARGVLCTEAYTASVCSPSRCAIVTGSYPNRIGYEFNINNLTAADAADGLPPSAVTIFHRMSAAGCTTGAIGKWHLGCRADTHGLGNRPQDMQVDEFLGIWKGSRNYTVGGVTDTGTLRETIRVPFRDTVLEKTAPWNTTYRYVTEAFGRGAVDFIDRHHADARPFFLYVAFTAPHSPIGPSPDFNDSRLAGLSGKRKEYASMVLTMDKEIGRLMDKLADPLGDGTGDGHDDDSILENTLVVFINDNGGASGIGASNIPLRDWKGSPWEGGIRVPMIFAGAGITAPGGSTFDKPVHSIDILPTCLAAIGGTPPSGIDGVNLLPFLNGEDNGQPHEHLVLRSAGRVGLRHGEWKLVHESGNAPFRLYDLAADLTESTDVAAANPELVARLLRELTAFEAGCDKPRHAQLNNGIDTINLNDRFQFKPVSDASGYARTGPYVVRNPGFESGIQADADARYTFAELDGWSNDGGDDGEVGAIDNDPHAGAYRGVFVAGRRVPYQLTYHTIAGGETMLLDFWHAGKSGWDAGDTFAVDLFYLEGVGLPHVLATATFDSLPSVWQREVHLFPPIADPRATGAKLGIRFRSNAGDSEFASIDDVLLSTGRVLGAGGATPTWSSPQAWQDFDTGENDTLLASDAFPGCILEFPVTDGFSWTARNDMTRSTGLEFMLNRLVFSGTFTGESPQAGTIDGNDLLFTDDLAGMPPGIHLDATGPGFSFTITADLLLYDDLEITGDGTAGLRIIGPIRDYHTTCGLTKNGASTVLLSGLHTYSGPTTISGGKLLLDDGASLANSDVTVGSGATLGGNGTVTGDISGGGTLAPGKSIGTFAVGGDAVFGSLVIEIDGSSNDLLEVTGTLDATAANLSLADLGDGLTDTVYVIASYGLLTGPFASVTGLPARYRLDHAYDDGISSHHIAVVSAAVPTPYAAWVADSGASGPEAEFAADVNSDGLANGLAFFLGLPDPEAEASTALPSGELKGDQFVIAFERADQAAGQRFFLEYATDLSAGDWVTARPGTDGVTLSLTDNGPTDRIAISLPTGLAQGASALFARLVVEE